MKIRHMLLVTLAAMVPQAVHAFGGSLFDELDGLRQSMYREFDTMRKEVERRRPMDLVMFGSNMKVDVLDSTDGKNIVVKASLPGYEKNDIKVTVKDGVYLTISAEKKDEVRDEKKEKGYYLREISSGYQRVVRTVRLPHEVKVDSISAEYKNGLLTIVLPKKDEPKQASGVSVPVK